jgi:hypothetical protein
MSSTAGAVIGAIVGVAALIFLIVAFFKSILTVREKEQVILERCGRFKAVLTPGMHCILPFIDRPKRFSARYYLETPTGAVQLVEKLNQTRVLTQDEIMDLPKQACIVSSLRQSLRVLCRQARSSRDCMQRSLECIPGTLPHSVSTVSPPAASLCSAPPPQTRDNASISLDVLLSYKIVNPRQCLYHSQNLPLMMSKVLQAQVRAVAGSLDVDSIIEETTTMDRVAGELGAVASRWGVSGACAGGAGQAARAGGFSRLFHARPRRPCYAPLTLPPGLCLPPSRALQSPSCASSGWTRAA